MNVVVSALMVVLAMTGVKDESSGTGASIPLHDAVKSGNVDAVTALLKEGSPIEDADNK